MPGKKIITNLVLFGVVFFLSLGSLEIVFRIVRFTKTSREIKTAAPVSGKNIQNPLGWYGNSYFGNPNTTRKKILFLGDSYTHGAEINTQRASLYFHVLCQLLNAEEFAFAAGGYGTTQEYLALYALYDQIRPDLVILQVGENDFINNSWKLESKSYINNNHTVRPYLMNGRIVYRYPGNENRYRSFLTKHSEFFRYFFLAWDKFAAILAYKGLLPSSDHLIHKKGLEYQDFKESVETTSELIRRMKVKLGKTPLVVFPADTSQPACDQFKKIFKRYNIPFIVEVPLTMKVYQQRGIHLVLRDGSHWNENGHRVCAFVLQKNLKRLGLV